MELKREIHPNLAIISCIGNTGDSPVDFSTRQYGSHFMFAIKAGLEYPAGTMMTVLDS